MNTQNEKKYDFCPVQRILSRIYSSESGRHLLNARKEILLAIKSIIDKEVERTEEMKREKKAEKVNIE
jgi:hypothetical protein